MGNKTSNPGILREVTLPVLSNAECAEVWGNVTQELWGNVTQHLTDGKLCTYVPQGDKTICYGDSGGSLSVADSDNRFTLIGLSSYVQPGCVEGLGAFTRVTYYLQWIKDQTGSFDDSI